MGEETGVGSGSVYNERDLFSTKEEDNKYASEKSAQAQVTFEREHTKDKNGVWTKTPTVL